MDDAEIYILKQVLLSYGCQRDGCMPYSLWTLIYKTENYEDLMHTLYTLDQMGTIEITLGNTRPDDLFVIRDEGTDREKYVVNWELVKDLEKNRKNEDLYYPCIGISIDSDYTRRILKKMNKEIKEFISGVAVRERIPRFMRDGRKEPKTKNLPGYMVSKKNKNFLPYHKQKAYLLNKFYYLHAELENDVLVFNLPQLESENDHIDFLRCFLALEKEVYIEILELSRPQKEEDVFVRIKLLERFKKELKVGLDRIELKNKPDNFDYDPESGTGNNSGKKFKLTDGTNEYTLFNECYLNRGKKIPRETVLKILKLTLDESDTSIGKALKTRRKSTVRTSNTLHINKVVTEIRSKTKLTDEEFVQNNGNLTLKK